MNKEQYWEEKNARLRYQKMRRLLESGNGTHRICWQPAGSEKTKAGQWVYDSEDEAQADAERFRAKGFCDNAFVEAREP